MKRSRSIAQVVALLSLVLVTGAWVISSDPPVADAAMDRAGSEVIRDLIENGADVNAAQGDGMTALHWVARNGDSESVELLVEAGADLSATTRLGAYTPLHLAARAGNAAVIRMLLEAGSDPDAVTSTGAATALHLAAQAGTAEGVQALVEHGADVSRADSARGQTPLMFAAAENRVDVVQVLLEAGADLSQATRVRDIRREAAMNRRANQVRDSVFAAFREEAQAAGEIQEGEGWQPTPAQIEVAVRTAQEVYHSGELTEEQEEELLSQDESYQSDWASRVGKMGGLTALHYAVRDGNREAVASLVDAGADIDQVSGDGTSPILMAAINGRYDIAMDLLERGADPNIRNDSNDSPLFATLETRWAPRVIHPAQHHWMEQETTHLELMEALLKAGAEPDVQLSKRIWYSEFNRSDLGIDFWGATPFFRATHALDLDAMKLLVEYGADPNIPTKNPSAPRHSYTWGSDADASGIPPIERGGAGAYPIHAATGVGHGQSAAGNVQRHVPDGWLPAVKYLVNEHDADVNMRDHGGYTPLHNAAARGDNQLIEYLMSEGADITAVSRAGQTVADMANSPFVTQRPYPGTVALLESLGSYNNDICLACGDAVPSDEEEEGEGEEEQEGEGEGEGWF